MNVEIYIKGERLDLHKDESIIVKQVTQDLKDISKLFTDYSQTFNVPASRRNNQILKNWFNADIDNGFDARTRVQATINVNTLHFKTGKIRLDGAEIKNNQPTNYKLTFFTNVIQIKDLLADDKLSSLEWLNNFNHEYSGDIVKDGLTTGLDFTVDSVNYDSAVIYPLISYQRQFFYNSNSSDTTSTDELVNIAYNASRTDGVKSTSLKPAIKLDLIIKAIQEKYPSLIFNSPFFESEIFQKIYVNLNNTNDSIANGYLIVEDLTTDTPPESSASDDIIRYFFSITPDTGFEDVPYKIRVTYNGQVKYESPNFLYGNSGEKRVTIQTPTNEARWILEVITELDFDFSADTNLIAQQFLLPPYSLGTYPNAYTGLSIDLSGEPLSEVQDIETYDFLTNIFKIFNLIATSEGDEIYIQDLQSWYTEGKIYDITKYVDFETESIKRGRIYKDISFTFEESKQILWNNFKSANNSGYGDLEFRLTDEDGNSENIDGDKLEIEAIFENPIFERLNDLDNNSQTSIQYCPYFDENIKPISGNMFMFYANAVDISSNPIGFVNNLVYEELNNVVLMPSHSYIINDESFNLNFNAEVNENTFSIYDDTIYKRFYDDYITDMFSIKRRMYNYKALLPEYLLNNLKLNDRLIIKDRRYIINSISNDLVMREDNLELINDIYEAPLASDILNTSLFNPSSRVYSSIENTYDIQYVGISGLTTIAVDFGFGVGDINVITKLTTGTITNVKFKLETNTTGSTRYFGIQVVDGINDPIFKIQQND